MLERGGGEADTLLGGGEESQAAGKGDLSHMPRISIREDSVLCVGVQPQAGGDLSPLCRVLLPGGRRAPFLPPQWAGPAWCCPWLCGLFPRQICVFFISHSIQKRRAMLPGSHVTANCKVGRL